MGGLQLAAVVEPAIARAHPFDPVGRNPGFDQPHGGVHRGLAAAKDHEMRWRIGRFKPQSRQIPRDGAARAGSDSEGGRVGRGNRGLEPRRIHQLAPHRNALFGPRKDAAQGVQAAAVPAIIGQRQIRHPPARQQFFAHHPVIIGEDFGMAGERIHPGIVPVCINPVGAQFERIDPVSRAWLMQRDEGIGVVPMAAGARMAIHNGDVAIGIFVDQRIGKGEAHRARANDQVIGCDVGQAASPPVMPRRSSINPAGLRGHFHRPLPASNGHGARRRCADHRRTRRPMRWRWAGRGGALH